MHHGAAALGIPAVVLFGGYTPIELTGYPPLHVNLAGNSLAACGSLYRCEHCIKAMESIMATEVIHHALRLLR
jgi:ADP-heptose:LPS heptosyltransferase